MREMKMEGKIEEGKGKIGCGMEKGREWVSE